MPVSSTFKALKSLAIFGSKSKKQVQKQSGQGVPQEALPSQGLLPIDQGLREPASELPPAALQSSRPTIQIATQVSITFYKHNKSQELIARLLSVYRLYETALKYGSEILLFNHSRCSEALGFRKLLGLKSTDILDTQDHPAFEMHQNGLRGMNPLGDNATLDQTNNMRTAFANTLGATYIDTCLELLGLITILQVIDRAIPWLKQLLTATMYDEIVQAVETSLSPAIRRHQAVGLGISGVPDLDTRFRPQSINPLMASQIKEGKVRLRGGGDSEARTRFGFRLPSIGQSTSGQRIQGTSGNSASNAEHTLSRSSRLTSYSTVHIPLPSARTFTNSTTALPRPEDAQAIRFLPQSPSPLRPMASTGNFRGPRTLTHQASGANLTLEEAEKKMKALNQAAFRPSPANTAESRPLTHQHSTPNFRHQEHQGITKPVQKKASFIKSILKNRKSATTLKSKKPAISISSPLAVTHIASGSHLSHANMDRLPKPTDRPTISSDSSSSSASSSTSSLDSFNLSLLDQETQAKEVLTQLLTMRAVFQKALDTVAKPVHPFLTINKVINIAVAYGWFSIVPKEEENAAATVFTVAPRKTG